MSIATNTQCIITRRYNKPPVTISMPHTLLPRLSSTRSLQTTLNCTNNQTNHPPSHSQPHDLTTQPHIPSRHEKGNSKKPLNFQPQPTRPPVRPPIIANHTPQHITHPRRIDRASPVPTTHFPTCLAPARHANTSHTHMHTHTHTYAHRLLATCVARGLG